MPRQPTGRPRGRPVGSGAILEREQIRLTVRIPATLFGRVEQYAEGQHYTGAAPELAGVVRAALEHFLDCQYKRQTHNVHTVASDDHGQTGNGATHTWQTNKGAETVFPMLGLAGGDSRQTANHTEAQASMPAEEHRENGRTDNSTESHPDMEAARGGESAQTRRERRLALILETLEHTSTGMRSADIRTVTGLSKTEVANDLRDLGKRGEVVKLGEGRYTRRLVKQGVGQ